MRGMYLRDPQPRIFKSFADMGGVLCHWVFDDADGDHETLKLAISECIPDARENILAKINPKRVNRSEFLGEWYSEINMSLIMKGSVRMGNGEELEDPSYEDLGVRPILNRVSFLGEVGDPQGYAYAFARPPYGLQASLPEVNRLFRSVLSVVMPDHCQVECFDWTCASLEALSTFFDDGAEWWGIYLFTAYVPEMRQLTVMAASATD